MHMHLSPIVAATHTLVPSALFEIAPAVTMFLCFAGVLLTQRTLVPAVQRRIERELHGVTVNLEAVVNNAMDAIITVNAQGTVRSCNPAAEEIFGRSRSEIV